MLSLSIIILNSQHEEGARDVNYICKSSFFYLKLQSSLQKSSFTNFSLTSWPIVLGVLEYLLRYAQRVVNLSQDVDDYEFEGPISRDKENDPLEMIIMGYKKFLSHVNAGEDSDHALLGYIFYRKLMSDAYQQIRKRAGSINLSRLG